MDKRELGKEASLEAARESLIAISYLTPDKVLSSVETLDSVDIAHATNGDSADDFRSKLISISYLQSPDDGLKN